MTEYCRTERDGHILLITLDRPKVHNSLNSPACFELHRIFDDFEADPDMWVAIITGAGERAFCAGHDLADAPDAPMPPSGWAGLAERAGRRKPLIAAVNGLAFGGGFEIVLACDIVIASHQTVFAMSEPRVGAVALGGVTPVVFRDELLFASCWHLLFVQQCLDTHLLPTAADAPAVIYRKPFVFRFPIMAHPRRNILLSIEHIRHKP